MGSDSGEPVDQVNSALQALAGLQQMRLLACSSLYVTRPIGPIAQADFVNAVALLATSLKPARLLAELQRIEEQHDRIRIGERWGPRTLDLDILLYGELQIAGPDLTVPHLQISRRAFVLVPLLELNAELMIPGHGQVADLLSAVDQTGVQKMAWHNA